MIRHRCEAVIRFVPFDCARGEVEGPESGSSGPVVRGSVLHCATNQSVVLTSQVPDPLRPHHPVTTIRVNRRHPWFHPKDAKPVGWFGGARGSLRSRARLRVESRSGCNPTRLLPARSGQPRRRNLTRHTGPTHGLGCAVVTGGLGQRPARRSRKRLPGRRDPARSVHGHRNCHASGASKVAHDLARPVMGSE